MKTLELIKHQNFKCPLLSKTNQLKPQNSFSDRRTYYQTLPSLNLQIPRSSSFDPFRPACVSLDFPRAQVYCGVGRCPELRQVRNEETLFLFIFLTALSCQFALHGWTLFTGCNLAVLCT